MHLKLHLNTEANMDCRGLSSKNGTMCCQESRHAGIQTASTTEYSVQITASCTHVSQYCHNFEVVRGQNWWYHSSLISRTDDICLTYLALYLNLLSHVAVCSKTLNTRLNQNMVICQSSSTPHQLSKWPPGSASVQYPVISLSSICYHPFPPCSFHFFPVISFINGSFSFS